MRTLRQKQIEALKLENFENFQKWDKKTVKLRIVLCAGGNMWGGSSYGACITLHGENSISETGTVTIDGTYEHIYNIARGDNGDSSSITHYWDLKDFEKYNIEEPKFKCRVDGNCSGSEEAIDSILGTKKAFLSTSVTL